MIDYDKIGYLIRISKFNSDILEWEPLTVVKTIGQNQMRNVILSFLARNSKKFKFQIELFER